MKRYVSGLIVGCSLAGALCVITPVEAGVGFRGPCIPSYLSSQTYKGVSIAEFKGQGRSECPRTTAPGAIVDGPRRYTPSPTKGSGGAPPEKAKSCGNEVVPEPVTIVPGAGGRVAQWTTPDGTVEFANEVDIGSVKAPGSGLVPPTYALSIIGQAALSMRLYNNDQMYGGTNGWQCTGGTWRHKDFCADFANPTTQACLFIGPPTTVTGLPGGPPNPRQAMLDNNVSVAGLISSGAMGTSPSDTSRQFVNLPSCWWVTGTTADQSFVLQIQPPPDDTGRTLTYVYRIDVGLQNVHWDYGDGSSYDGDVGQPYSAGGGCANAHTYDRVSRIGNPGAVACPPGYPHPTADDGCYLVQATETYAASITAYWWEGSQNHGPIDMGTMAPVTLQVQPPTYVRVLQIEGVPVSR